MLASPDIAVKLKVKPQYLAVGVLDQSELTIILLSVVIHFNIIFYVIRIKTCQSVIPIAYCTRNPSIKGILYNLSQETTIFA